MSHNAFRYELEQRKGQQKQIQKDITNYEQERRKLKRKLINCEKAKAIIREVSLATQQQLQYNISEITSLALDAVFPDPYSLQAEFVQRRNKTECDLFFVRDKKKIDPISASGGGAVDVAAFALRTASWSMAIPRTRNVLILDEPFIHLKGKEANGRALDIVNELSKRMEVQIIMVSDERVPKAEIVERSDQVFEVAIEKGISMIV